MCALFLVSSVRYRIRLESILYNRMQVKLGGFVATNVRIRWNPVYKAFNRIRSCGNEQIDR